MTSLHDRLLINEDHLRGALSRIFCCRIRILNPVPTEPDHTGSWQPLHVAAQLEGQVDKANMASGTNCMVEYEHRATIRDKPDDTQPILLLTSC